MPGPAWAPTTAPSGCNSRVSATGSRAPARRWADSAQRVAAALEPVAETLLLQPLGAVVGAHAGPGTVGVGCYPAELFPLGLKVAAGAAERR